LCGCSPLFAVAVRASHGHFLDVFHLGRDTFHLEIVRRRGLVIAPSVVIAIIAAGAGFVGVGGVAFGVFELEVFLEVLAVVIVRRVLALFEGRERRGREVYERESWPEKRAGGRGSNLSCRMLVGTFGETRDGAGAAVAALDGGASAAARWVARDLSCFSMSASLRSTSCSCKDPRRGGRGVNVVR
jgi:hypothetical protein